eukprot:554570_1
MSAPGSSAFNSIERRMAPLSKKLVGLVLDHQKLGNHLNSNKETIDDELEKANFGEAGRILGNIWSEAPVDGHVCDAQYVAPIDIDDKKEKFPHKYDEKWAAKHIKHGQYHLSIMKCSDPSCCSNVRSNIHDVLPSDKYPEPRYFVQDKGLLSLGEKHKNPPKNHHYASYQMICTLNKGFPHNEPNDCHDDFNPSLTAEALGDTKCRVCLKWFPSKK